MSKNKLIIGLALSMVFLLGIMVSGATRSFVEPAYAQESALQVGRYQRVGKEAGYLAVFDTATGTLWHCTYVFDNEKTCKYQYHIPGKQ